MASRQQKFNKVLTNKKANLELDIKELEAEVAPYLTHDLDAELTRLSVNKETVSSDIQQVQLKIADCNTKLLELEDEYKSFMVECDAELDQEKEIYEAEMERIAYIHNEWLDIKHDRQALLKEKLAIITKNIECLTHQQQCHKETLDNYKHVKRDIRADMLRELITKQAKVKADKAYIDQHTNHVSLLESTVAALSSWITNYPEARLKINKDYYDWLDEITKLKSGTTQDFQQQLLLALEADPRQNYKLLFAELDNELISKQRQLNKAQAQLNKFRQSITQLEKPILLPVRNPDHNDILQENICTKECHFDICKELDMLMCDKELLSTELATLTAELMATQLPTEIQIWKDRAEERWTIINERIATKCNAYETKYIASRTELRESLNALTNLESTLLERANTDSNNTALVLSLEQKKKTLARLEELRNELALLE